ncbi:aspartate kinase [Bacillus sp. NRRL B-14911]|uniref:Aspartokinase n=2 Tax=Bacillales TaxID=1385 RepID=U5L5C7_9BACI|nr:aspartate kinase [Bacillus infantis NRRL B-14911]EAR67351.1 aspartate kinase [Bacillus sp. NRRL B-14911]
MGDVKMKVVKFGGSSLASGRAVEKVFEIAAADESRKIIVVSAPGKRFPEDEKVTDMLIDCGIYALEKEGMPPKLEKIVERYSRIAAELGLDNKAEEVRGRLLDTMASGKERPEYFLEKVKACGEDLNARLIAEYFSSRGIEASYVNPGEAGLYVTDEPGNARALPEAYINLKSLRERKGIIIFPGFFGYSKQGDVLTFSRSGSDITGSILANGIEAELYENFTDVDAVYSVNPHTVSSPKEIRELTYREMRELSYAGFSVFHDEALIPAYKAGITVNVKNTNNPEAPGTRIVGERDNTNGPVIGIASDKGFCSIYVSKYLMNREIGFGRRILQILEDFGLSYEHTPSGIDDLSIILRQHQFDHAAEEQIAARIKEELEADEVVIEHDLALIMVVGEGMRHNVGTMARASKALAAAKVNIEMINQGSSEVSMMFGVKENDESRAVKALYEEFFEPARTAVR